MGKLEPTWICQIPFQDMTNEKFSALTDTEKGNYGRGYQVPENKDVEKIYVAYVDGGCYANGSVEAEAYGSYHIYDVTNLAFRGIIPSNIHQMTQDPRFIPHYYNERFPIGLGNNKKATNNFAEASSMHMVLLAGINQSLINPKNHMFIFSDSELIINHLKGIYSVKNAQLAEVYKNVHKFLNTYQQKFNNTAWNDFNIEKIPGTLMKKILGH